MKTPLAGPTLERRIWLIRGQRVMLDSDLAEVYGVSTKRLNEQVKRNRGRFPGDFMFRLSAKEARALQGSRLQTATMKRGQNIKYRPFVFTEHGAVMMASVLNTAVAVKASVQVVRAFLWVRRMLAMHEDLRRKLEEHELRLSAHDDEIRRLYEAIQEYGAPREAPKRRIGFEAVKVPDCDLEEWPSRAAVCVSRGARETTTAAWTSGATCR